MILSRLDLSYESACRKEYLLVDGDCYSSSSLAGNTRKYHGMLVKNGYVLLSTIDELVNGFRISRATYKKAVVCPEVLAYYHPARFCYWIDGVFVEKRVELARNSVRVSYRASERVTFEVIPLLAMRSVHSVRKDFEDIRGGIEGNCRGFVARAAPYSLRVEVGGEEVEAERVDYVYYDVFYPRECERGYECCENLYAPFKFRVRGRNLNVTARVEGFPVGKGEEVFRSALTPESMLEKACDAFLREDTIVAGYHWFTESWGRDAFVSLPGLLLERGLFGQARRVFLYFARRMKGGVIPNRVGKDISYNSSDASLWFVYALNRYMEKTNDREFLYRVKVYIEELFESYPESDVAVVGERGLLEVKPQTTWMDTIFTPREGMPVEVNALWINALAFAERYGIDVDFDWRKVFREFWEVFWNGEYLDDVAGDSSFRPNQVVALAVLTRLLKRDEEKEGADRSNRWGEIFENAAKALRLCEEKLLTPYGLRTLSPEEEGYIGRYCGDKSYHNGCVWPWLLGFYFELRKNLDLKTSRFVLMPLLSHLYDCGIGFVSEIFDGDSPYNPNGCIAQAWSVAELYRALKMCEL